MVTSTAATGGELAIALGIYAMLILVIFTIVMAAIIAEDNHARKDRINTYY